MLADVSVASGSAYRVNVARETLSLCISHQDQGFVKACFQRLKSMMQRWCSFHIESMKKNE